MKCVAGRLVEGELRYLTARKGTDSMYVSRSTWADIDQAKIFANANAAVNSARQNLGHDDFQVFPVTWMIGDPIDRKKSS